MKMNPLEGLQIFRTARYLKLLYEICKYFVLVLRVKLNFWQLYCSNYLYQTKTLNVNFFKGEKGCS